jgi:hypothetical protein
LTAAFVFAAQALAAGQFYVALDTSTRECHVMDTRRHDAEDGSAAARAVRRYLLKSIRLVQAKGECAD